MPFHMTSRRAGYLKPAPMAVIQSSLIRAGEVAATAGFFSALTAYNAVQGKAPTERMPAVAGIPADLITGLLLHGIALGGGVPSMYSTHMQAVADGALASYAMHLGAGLGLNMGQGAAGSPAAARAQTMAKTGEYQIRMDAPATAAPAAGSVAVSANAATAGLTDYSKDPYVKALMEANPHLSPAQVVAAMSSR